MPSSIVEPAIAATIEGMVLFDFWSRSCIRFQANVGRLALVFLCALIVATWWFVGRVASQA